MICRVAPKVSYRCPPCLASRYLGITKMPWRHIGLGGMPSQAEYQRKLGIKGSKRLVCQSGGASMLEIREGQRVLARTSGDRLLPRRAASGVVQGDDIPVV